jgi:NTP pyrophosphatase (non-canonical NTP hydrolase)
MTLEEKEKAIIDNYGVINQLKHFQSEVWELNEAIIKYEYELDGDNYSSFTDELKEHIAEEIADVQLMLNQFKRYYNISDKEIEEVMQYKADRQLKRIEESK